MLSTVEKVKRLEGYLAISNMTVDPIIELTINKLLMREYERVAEIKNRLNNEVTQLEKQYAMDSNSFHQRYETGELGDEMDFIEWSATLEMLKQIEKQLTWLETARDDKMNSLITQRFNAIEERLLQSNSVVSYHIIRKEVTLQSGKIRFKVFFTDRSVAEFFEYVFVEADTILLSKYSFHWQNAEGTLKSRWDNAPHHPELPNAPHHKHNSDLSVIGINDSVDTFYVLNAIEQAIS